VAFGRRPSPSRWIVIGLISAGLFVALFFVAVIGILLAISGSDNNNSLNIPSEIVRSNGIPPEYVKLISDAANGAGCAQVTPALLAAQLHQESNFNPNARSAAGALGIAQFLPGTWARYGGGGDIWNPSDAIPAAARYDCAVAADVAQVQGDPRENMLAAYNAGPDAVRVNAGVPPYPETMNYVRAILSQADAYGDALISDVPATGDVARMLSFMRAQVGKPYVWGASGPDAWDCSSLVQAAYHQIGIDLPRVTQNQVDASPQVDGADPQIGDLIFTIGSTGTPTSPGHVIMYIGNGKVESAKGAQWGVVVYDLSQVTGVVAVTRPLAGARNR
jgi:cell wall-associated NlpC family hydrolase